MSRRGQARQRSPGQVLRSGVQIALIQATQECSHSTASYARVAQSLTCQSSTYNDMQSSGLERGCVGNSWMSSWLFASSRALSHHSPFVAIPATSTRAREQGGVMRGAVWGCLCERKKKRQERAVRNARALSALAQHASTVGHDTAHCNMASFQSCTATRAQRTCMCWLSSTTGPTLLQREHCNRHGHRLCTQPWPHRRTTPQARTSAPSSSVRPLKR